MKYTALILLVGSALFGQAPDGITVYVTRSVNIAPDEADFTVTVDTTLDVTQQQVAQVFQDLGVQNLSVNGVNAYPGNSSAQTSQLSYQVAFTATPAAIKDYAQKFDTLNSKLPSGFAYVQYNASLTASQAAVDTMHQALLPQLLTDARTRAQQLASAAGLRVGAILAITDGTSGALVTYAIRSGNFSALAKSGTRATETAGTVTLGAPYTFYATVTFAGQ